MRWTRDYGKIFLALVVAATLALPALVVGDPRRMDPARRLGPLTDHLGRSLPARIYYGFWISAASVALTMAGTLLVAVPLGMAAGTRPLPGLEAVAGAVWSLPTLLVGLVVFMPAKGRWVPVKFLLLGLFNWVPVYRTVRDLTAHVAVSPHVLFARALGLPPARVFVLHVLRPVVMGAFPVILLNAVTVFEAEFVLSFLGLTYPAPVPTLGGILRQGIAYLHLPMIGGPTVLLALVVGTCVVLYRRMETAHEPAG